MAEKKPQNDLQHEPQRPQKQDNKSTQKKVKGSVPANPAHHPIPSKQGKQPPIKAPQLPVNRSNPIAVILHATAQFLAGKFSPEVFAPMLARFYESFALYMQSPQAMTGQAQHALKNYLYGLETSVGSQGTAHDPRQNASLEQLKTQLSQIEAQYPYPQFMLGHYAHQTKAYIEAFQQRSTSTEPQNTTSSGKGTTLELDLAKVMISQDTTTQQGSTVLLGLLANKQFEEALKKKLQAEALKKAEQEVAKTVVKLSLKWGARVVAVVGMVLAPDQAHAPGTPLPIPKGYVLVKEGMFAGQLIKKLYISAAEAERVGKELQKMLQMTSVSAQSHLLVNQLRHLIFAFRSRLPQGPIDPNKHRLEQYDDWGLEKQLSFLRNHYQDLSPAAKRTLLRALYESKGAYPRSAFGDLTEEELQEFYALEDKGFDNLNPQELTRYRELENILINGREGQDPIMPGKYNNIVYIRFEENEAGKKPYIGISKNSWQKRYGRTKLHEIRDKGPLDFIEKLKLDFEYDSFSTLNDIENALMELNEGPNEKDAPPNPRLANKKWSAYRGFGNQTRTLPESIAAGEAWLDRNIPDWRRRFKVDKYMKK
jgi:hypothetical protein